MITVVAGKVLNHKPDSWATRAKARPARKLLARAGAAPKPGQARPHVLSITNQGRLGACTGGGTTQAVRGAQHLEGVASPPLVSRLWAYYLGRLFDHDTGDDAGAQIGNVVRGLELYGLCPETVWPYNDDPSSAGTFRGPPPAESYRAAYDSIASFRAHRIESEGEALLYDCREALGQGRLVIFGSAVSNAYCENAFDPSRPLEAPSDSNIAGLHCECLGDFSADGSFDVVNDWDVGWGNLGWSKFSSGYLLDKNSSDFYIIDAAPLVPLVDDVTGGTP